jgi:hypothetical protein
MNAVHKAALAHEIVLARTRMGESQYAPAMIHLERAHVLGQRYVWPHVLVHWLMFRVAVRRLAPGSALGQLIRIALGALGSAVGRVPTGNTGGSNVNMFRRMPIPPDLLKVMGGAGP